MLLLPYTYKTEKLYHAYHKIPRIGQIMGLKIINKINNFNIQRLTTPIILTFFVTNQCNAKCKHCFYWKHLSQNISEELNLKEIKKIVSSLKHPLSTLLLTGGEPFLREDLAQICKIFYDINRTKKINIPTNGLMPKLIYKCARDIIENAGLFLSINVSLDGLEKKHDEIRGVQGTFQRAIETIGYLKNLEKRRSNFMVGVQTVISNRNYSEIEKLMDFVKKNFAVPHGFQFIRSTQSDVHSIDPLIVSDFTPPSGDFKLPSLEKLHRLNRTINNRKISENADLLLSKIDIINRQYLLEIIEKRKKIVPCLAGRIDGVLYPSGEVALCEYTKPFGNLRDFSLNFEKLWNSDEANERRKQVSQCVCAHSCNLMNSMRYDLNTLIKLL